MVQREPPKKGQREKQLAIIHKNIIKIAKRLREKYRAFDMISLFEICQKELPNPEPEIYQAIRDLFEMKYFVEGRELFKEEVLTNEKRSSIYEYVMKYPGAHVREIRKVFDLGSYMAYRHLAILEKFGFLRKKSYQNKLVYFPSDFEEIREAETLLLRNETTNSIFKYIRDQGQLRINEVSEALQMPYSTIQEHLQRLIDGNLVEKIKVDQTSYYVLKEKEQLGEKKENIEVKREFDYVGGTIRFKVAVRNRTNMAIHNIAVNLNPSDQFLADVSQQTISNLPPNTTRGIDFTLTPLTCGQSVIFGSVSYQDAFGNVFSIPIQQKEISIKCPLVQPLNATQQEVNEWIKNLKRGTGKIKYEKISDTEAFRIGREQVSALDLNEININQGSNWGLYSGQVKVTGKNMVVKVSVVNPNIVLDVWADDLKQTTGFIAYISNLINIALEGSYKMVRKTTDISRKIVSLMQATTILDKMFENCSNQGTVSEILSHLKQINTTIEEGCSDSALIRSLKDTCSYYEGIIDPNSAIDDTDANELKYKCLSWLHKIHDLVEYHIQTYKETYDDLNHLSEEFVRGATAIFDKISQREKDYALGILSYLMILEKKSGICVFEKNLGDLRMNADLIGGFLHALQSFGLEISKKESSMKRLTYESYQFQIETGQFVRSALILRGTPNDYIITNLEQFVKQFERNFAEDLKIFSGNMDLFKPANALFDAFFK